MEDAIALFRAFQEHPHGIEEALDLFVETRKPQVDKLLAGARGSYEWYEGFASRLALDPIALAYDYMTRSGRVSEERLAKIAPRFTNAWRAQKSTPRPVPR